MSKPLYEIIERPIITEKSVKESMNNRYTFRCKTSANKTEIKKALEELFEIKIAAVNTHIIKGKRRQVGRARPGKIADYKKAIISLQDDSQATKLKEIFEGA